MAGGDDNPVMGLTRCKVSSGNRFEIRSIVSQESFLPAYGWAGEKLVLTGLEGRFRDASFCCARWKDVASERSLSPPCEGGVGGVMREP